VPSGGDALDALPADARARLEAFSEALEKINVGDLALYAPPSNQADRDRAADAAAAVARERGLEPAIEAAREAILDYVGRMYQNAMMRIGFMGTTPASGFGQDDDQVRVMRSLGDAVTAIVLGDALDEADQGQLLGEWDSLIE
jgi:hypothetical protein